MHRYTSTRDTNQHTWCFCTLQLGLCLHFASVRGKFRCLQNDVICALTYSLLYVDQSEQSVRAGFRCSLRLLKLPVVKIWRQVVWHTCQNMASNLWRWFLELILEHVSWFVELVSLAIRTIVVCTITAVWPTLRYSIGDRTFPVAAAHTWNSLSPSVTELQSLQTFRKTLKTELFQRLYATSSFPWLVFL